MVEAVRAPALGCWFLPIAWLLLTSAAFAHRLDEYLQATIVEIAPGEIRLKINLMPGVEVAEKVLAQLDSDHDGVISPREAADYAEAVKSELSAQIDQHNLELKLTGSAFPPPEELRTGWGIIQLEFSAKPLALPTGAHAFTFQNRHLRALSVYLLNAAWPKTAEVEITSQKRNDTQSEGEISFLLHPLQIPEH